MDGGQDGLLSIGRFAKRARLSVHRLRRYHDAGLLEAALVDEDSGYRYYSPAQAERAEVIALLRSLDVPLAEVQVLLRDPSEPTVRRLLAGHRVRLEERLAEARERLRLLDRLAAQESITVRSVEMSREDVEVRVESVRTHLPGDRHVLLLREPGGERLLSLWIGPAEAAAIQSQLDGIALTRPITYDLLLGALERAGGRVESVAVTHLTDETFYARVDVRTAERLESLDARPSDAVNIALRTGAPILASADLLRDALERSGREVELVDKHGAVVARVVADRPIQPGWVTSVQTRLGPPPRWQGVGAQTPDDAGRAVVRRLEGPASEP
jgi:bifunctional DNase/RNase